MHKNHSPTIFAKTILEGRGETQNNFVYGELGRTSLKSRHDVNVIRYWFNIKYVKNMFSLMYRKEIIIRPICHMQVMLKMRLQSIDLYEAWVNQGLGNINVLSVW